MVCHPNAYANLSRGGSRDLSKKVGCLLLAKVMSWSDGLLVRSGVGESLIGTVPYGRDTRHALVVETVKRFLSKRKNQKFMFESQRGSFPRLRSGLKPYLVTGRFSTPLGAGT